MSDNAPVLVAEQNHIATVTINRPEVHNALDEPLVDALDDAFAALARKEELAAVILTSAGGKAFVSGADIAQLRERRAPEAFRRINQGLFRRIAEFPAPTIAAVCGWALGGGCELAMACDLRVAGRGAKFGQPEVGLGIIPGAGGTHRLERLVGLGKARELIFTGAIIDAEEALRIGLVNRVVNDEAVLTEAEALATTIAKQSVGAVRFAKLAVNAAPDLGDRGRDMVEFLAQGHCFESPDKITRMTRFLERKNKKK